MSIKFRNPAAFQTALKLGIADFKKACYIEIISLDVQLNADHEIVTHAFYKLNAILFSWITAYVIRLGNDKRNIG